MKILYFAWLRERIGAPFEEVQTEAVTVADLIKQLRAIDERHALALSDMRSVRVAVDQELAEPSTPLAGAREVAFFPPMTGG